MTEHKRFEARLNVYISAELQRKLEQIRDQRGPKVTVPDIVREAVRLYIDNEEEIIGSRRHFQRNLRDSITTAELELMWTQSLLLAFQWQSVHSMNSTMSFREALEKATDFAKRNWKSMSEAMLTAQKVIAAEVEEEAKKQQ